jgi:lactate dehydrogenase-like 2-hydroxyacid dehydrogenase
MNINSFIKTCERFKKRENHRLFFSLKKFNILASEHIGFWDNKSIETACHTFIENIQQALDTNLLVVGIFLNLFKGYDVIN